MITKFKIYEGNEDNIEEISELVSDHKKNEKIKRDILRYG